MADASLTSAEAIMADAKAGQDEVLGSFLLKFINIDSRLEIQVVSRHNLFMYIYVYV